MDPVVDPATAVQPDPGSKPGGTQPVQTVEVPEVLSGVYTPEEWSKLSEVDRTRFEEKGKRLDGSYTQKFQRIAELSRIQEDLDADPEKATHLKKAMTEYEARKAGLLPKVGSEAVKNRLDTMLDGATAEQQQAIKSLVEALDERYKTDLSEKEKKLTELEQTVKSLLSDTQSSRREVLEKELAGLPEGYKSLAEKYRATILQAGTRTDGLHYTAKRLLQIVSSPDELESAIMASAPEQARKLAEKTRQTATAKPTSTVAVAETPEAKRLASRDVRFKKGPIDIQSSLQDIFATVKRGMGAA